MNLNDYNIYLNYARQYLQQNNEAAFVAYRIALHLAPQEQKSNLNNEYNNFLATASINENELGRTCTELMLERINNGEYKETLAILTGLIFDPNPYLFHIFCVKYNLLLYILTEASLCELGHGIAEADVSMNQYESLDDFFMTYEQLKFLCRRIWFHIGHDEALTRINELLTEQKCSIDLLSTILKYAIARPCYKIVFDDICNYLTEINSTYAILFQQYDNWLCAHIPQNNDLLFTAHSVQSPELQPIYINAANPPVAHGTKDPNQISIIFCTNQRAYADELMHYLKTLAIPQGYSLEVLAVTNATSMAQGYNAGMHASQAKYKLYIHHDTFIIDKDILKKVVNIFNQDTSIGMLGIAGATHLPADGVWWNAESNDHRTCIIQDNFLDIMISAKNNQDLLDSVENVEALDGVFLATSQDIEWRSDLFDGWHFYDISQCQEFIRSNLRVVYYNSSVPVVLHELSLNQYEDLTYDQFRKKFCQYYLS